MKSLAGLMFVFAFGVFSSGATYARDFQLTSKCYVVPESLQLLLDLGSYLNEKSQLCIESAQVLFTSAGEPFLNFKIKGTSYASTLMRAKEESSSSPSVFTAVVIRSEKRERPFDESESTSLTLTIYADFSDRSHSRLFLDQMEFRHVVDIDPYHPGETLLESRVLSNAVTTGFQSQVP